MICVLPTEPTYARVDKCSSTSQKLTCHAAKSVGWTAVKAKFQLPAIPATNPKWYTHAFWNTNILDYGQIFPWKLIQEPSSLHATFFKDLQVQTGPNCMLPPSAPSHAPLRHVSVCGCFCASSTSAWHGWHGLRWIGAEVWKVPHRPGLENGLRHLFQLGSSCIQASTSVRLKKC